MEKYDVQSKTNTTFLDSVIIAHDIQKTYPGTHPGERVGVGTLTGLSFEVKRNEVFGIIGPNGAGKSTLFRLMTTLLKPDHGQLTILEHDAVKSYKEIRRHIGYMPGVFALYPDLTVEENLNFFATLFGTTPQENYALIREIYKQIEPFKTRKAHNLSGGMKQKLALCCALIHKPQILFLDEPTTGIDPLSRVDLWDMLRTLSSSGVTVVVSTAYMDEANRCDRVAFMLNGNFLATDKPSHFEQNYPYQLVAVQGNDRLKLIERLRLYPQTIHCYAFGDTLHLSLPDTCSSTEVQAYLQQAGLMATITPITASIEDAFIHLSHCPKS